MLRNLKIAIILLLINSSNLFSQDKINVPVTGDWEYGGVLLDNENLIIEIDFKLTQFECEKSNFGNSDNLFRYRITNKKKNFTLEDNFLSFKIIFQDCLVILICKTLYLNIGLKKKNDVWDGLQPLDDPNMDNSFRGKKLIIPFSEVVISKIRNSTKDGECYNKVAKIPEVSKPPVSKIVTEQKNDNKEADDIILKSNFPEIKIVKKGEFHLKPDIFSDPVGNLTVDKKVLLLGRQGGFWKIKFKEREGFILIGDQILEESTAKQKLNEALIEVDEKENTFLEKSKQQLTDNTTKPALQDESKLKAEASNIFFNNREAKFNKNPEFNSEFKYIPKLSQLTISDYSNGFWKVLFNNETGYLADDLVYFNMNSYLQNLKDNSFASKNTIINIASEQEFPTYPGGETELQTSIKSKLKYSYSSRSGKSIEVQIELDINEFGIIENIKILNSSSIAIEEDILQALKLIKPFIPAKKNGVGVKSRISLKLLVS